MQRAKNRFQNWHFLFILLTFVIFIPNLPSSFADRVINYETVADVREDSLVSTISNIQNYPQIFPDNIRSIKIIDNKTNLIEMVAGADGIYFDAQATYHETQDGKYIIQVVSGDLNGTTLTTELNKTWGFDGRPNQGTVAYINLDLKASGFLSWALGMIPDESLTYALENSFARFVQYAK